MLNRAHRSPTSGEATDRNRRFATDRFSAPALTPEELRRLASDWLIDGEVRQWSRQTLAARRFLVEKLLWFLEERRVAGCGPSELRAFLQHVSRGHEGGGRWGSASPRARKAVRPRTVATYYGHLKALFNFIVREGALDASPMERIAAPVARADQIQPFTAEQVQALLAAARRTRYPRRDEALLLFLLDTGCRASEACGLRRQDLDLQGRRCRVLGKGNKERTVFFGATTARLLYAYLRENPREPEEPLFSGERGEGLTRSGLLQLVERLGKMAGIAGVRCSPHTFRHTFAVEFLRAGGNVFALKELLGHTTLAMTNRYVALAQADMARQHRQFSPGDRLKRGA